MEILTIPAVDKSIAVVASLPFAWVIYHRLTGPAFSIPIIAVIVHSFVLVITMLFRQPAVRITPKASYWLLAFVATYGTLAPIAFLTFGPALAPPALTNSLAILSVAFLLYARMNLGRSIGFVPAQRTLVMSGAYRWVRHPIYSGIFLGYLGAVLRIYSTRNLIMYATISALFVIKSFVEEDFLRKDPAYERYMQEVRYRWIPGVI